VHFWLEEALRSHPWRTSCCWNNASVVYFNASFTYRHPQRLPALAEAARSADESARRGWSAAVFATAFSIFNRLPFHTNGSRIHHIKESAASESEETIVAPYVISTPEWLVGDAPVPAPPMWAERALVFFAGHIPLLYLSRLRFAIWQQLYSDPRATVFSRNLDSNLAQALASSGQLEAAEPLMREDLAHSLATLGPRHPDTLVSYNNLAQLLTLRGKLSEAEDLYRRELKHSKRTHGGEHPRTRACAQMLAAVLRSQGKSADALPLIRSLHGDRHPRTLSAITALAGKLYGEGKAEQAVPLAREALTTASSLLGDSHPFALVARAQLASVLRALGGTANEAEAKALCGP